MIENGVSLSTLFVFGDLLFGGEIFVLGLYGSTWSWVLFGCQENMCKNWQIGRKKWDHLYEKKKKKKQSLKFLF